jgi:SAM-dependent methyltransferase
LRRLAADLKNEGLPTPLFRFDLTDCPLAGETLDAVVGLNVLEHVKDDSRAIGQIFRLLRPGGVFVFEVPQGPALYDDYDRELCHYRRYSAKRLGAALAEGGFEKRKLSHLGVFVYPAFYLIKKWRSGRAPQRSPRESSDQPSSLSRRLIALSGGRVVGLSLKLELAIGKLIDWPFGIRCCGVYAKP